MIYYLIIILSFGFSLSLLFNRLNFINIKKLNFFEYTSYFAVLGFFAFSIYMFILGVLHISYNRIMFLFIIAFNIIMIVLYLIQLKKQKKNINTKLLMTKENILTLIVTILFILNVIFLIVVATSHNLTYPDEFSVWGLNSKNIFLGKKMTYFINTGLEIYPNFLPLLYSGFYIFINEIQENLVRVIPSLFFIILTLGMIGLAQKHKIKPWKIILANLFILNYYTAMIDITSSTYGDIVFSCCYTLGMLYFFEWLIFDESKENMLLSLLFLNCACWTKTDGVLMIASFNAFIMITYHLLNKKKLKISTNHNIKISCIFYVLSLLTGIVWKLYTVLASFPTELSAGAGSVFQLEIGYLEPLLKNMTLQQFSCIPWLILLILSIIYFFKKWDLMNKSSKIYYIFLILTVIFSMAFMFVCYLFIFGGEALVAASYIRYLTRAIFIMVFAVLYIEEGDIIK